MTEYSYCERYMLRDGKPWFPVMGEMHYSRYPKEYWNEALGKMRAGGVSVVSTYVFWIHHEEIEGEYDFEGSRDLREFVQTVAESGLKMFLRIGPWSHGECRNGGFPDWLLKKDFPLRSNDERYFEYVKRFYAKIYSQVAGLFHKDGGPIIGIQIENEYGHVGGMQGEEGEAHMKRLLAIAKELGFDAPYYTATGWGGAVTGGMLPVMGGYCEAPWEQSDKELAPNGNYVFTYERNDHNIASDYGLGEGLTFDASKFPFLTAELGGGLQVTHHRRPVARGRDIAAMSLCKLGSGCNLLGYYMYHGGTNPTGRLTTLQESKATGYPNDVPELSYDFNAPLREYGQPSDSFYELKLLTMFLDDFGSELCAMDADIPQDNPVLPQNFEDLRYSVRSNGASGYVFVNNYQRRYKMSGHKNVELKAKTKTGEIAFPPVDISDGDFFFLPYNMELEGGALLEAATAVPLCRLEANELDEKATYFFYTDKEAKYVLSGDTNKVNIMTLSRRVAKHAWKLDGHLLIAENVFAKMQSESGEILVLSGRGDMRFFTYPQLKEEPKGFSCMGAINTTEMLCEFPQKHSGELFGYEYKYSLPGFRGEVSVKKSAQHKADGTQCYELELSNVPDFYDAVRNSGAVISDCFLQINYVGDTAKLYADDELIADNFYTGQLWEIGLKRFKGISKLRLEIKPLFEDEFIYLEERPAFKDGCVCELGEVALQAEYQMAVSAN